MYSRWDESKEELHLQCPVAQWLGMHREATSEKQLGKGQ